MVRLLVGRIVEEIHPPEVVVGRCEIDDRMLNFEVPEENVCATFELETVEPVRRMGAVMREIESGYAGPISFDDARESVEEEAIESRIGDT